MNGFQVFACLLVMAQSAHAGDWPQILGPQRNGRAAGDEKVVSGFHPDGPRVVWKKQVGQGFAGPAVADGRLILFHRIADKETVECFDAATGESIWLFDYATDYRDDFGFDNGPRALPTIDGERVYTHGASGVLHGFDMQSGNPLWSVDTMKAFGSGKGFFGRACSPLVEGDLLILQVGGDGGAGIVAFDKHTGAVKWKATEDEAGYSSPVAATIGGRRMVLALTRDGLVALNPADGSVLFHRPFRSSQDASVNAATPVVIGDSVFLSACYGVGGALWRITPQGPTEVWANDTSLSNHYATSVVHGEMLYGFHGRQDQPPKPMLRCVELATGRVRWSTEPLGAGSLIVADDKLVVLTETGELIIAPATPAGFEPTARAQVLGFNTRAQPALSGGYFYARDPKQLICVDLRAEQE